MDLLAQWSDGWEVDFVWQDSKVSSWEKLGDVTRSSFSCLFVLFGLVDTQCEAAELFFLPRDSLN